MKKALLIIVCVLVVLAVAAAGACAVIWDKNVFSLDLSVAGDSEITLEYGSEYTAPEASAVFYGSILNKQPLGVDVVIEGSVDTSKVGDYVLTYTASYHADYKLVHKELTQSETRIVHIVDTQSPTITLVTNPDHFTFPNEPYSEEGFTASDDYDGDLTDLVQRVEENGVVIYRVSDSSGNTFEITRTIVYDDPIPPTLTLTEPADEDGTYVKYGKEYVDPGYTATDNCDGDITDKVVITGVPDTTKPGTYTLTYTVSDSQGNTVSAQREVTVLPNLPDIEIRFPNPALPPNGKVIYLTFDDGPGPYTSILLDTLAKYGVKATFFVVGTGNANLITRIANEGHTVAMHSATHNYNLIYSSEEAFFNDLYSIQALIQEKTGVAPTLLRFPGGSSNQISSFNPGIMTRLTEKLTKMGYHYFDWNVDSKDAGGANSSIEVLYNVVAGIGERSVSVVLQHDISYVSVMAVDTIIRWGIANGYTFLPLTESSPGMHHTVRN